MPDHPPRGSGTVGEREAAELLEQFSDGEDVVMPDGRYNFAGARALYRERVRAAYRDEVRAMVEGLKVGHSEACCDDLNAGPTCICGAEAHNVALDTLAARLDTPTTED